MNQVQQDLEATYDHLEDHGWCQGTFQAPDGRVCLEGAAAAVTMGAPNYWSTRRHYALAPWLDQFGPIRWHDVPRECIDRFADVLDALNAQVPVPPGRLTLSGVFVWNDVPQRTVEEVKDLIKAAIKAEADK